MRLSLRFLFMQLLGVLAGVEESQAVSCGADSFGRGVAAAPGPPKLSTASPGRLHSAFQVFSPDSVLFN